MIFSKTPVRVRVTRANLLSIPTENYLSLKQFKKRSRFAKLKVAIVLIFFMLLSGLATTQVSGQTLDIDKIKNYIATIQKTEPTQASQISVVQNPENPIVQSPEAKQAPTGLPLPDQILKQKADEQKLAKTKELQENPAQKIKSPPVLSKAPTEEIKNLNATSTTKCLLEFKTARATWYGEKFDGRTTSSGEFFSSTKLTAAHPTLPFGTVLVVRRESNKSEVEVRVNDRSTKNLDLSKAAMEKLDGISNGIVDIEYAVKDCGSEK
jgi:rare lipoprotein A